VWALRGRLRDLAQPAGHGRNGTDAFQFVDSLRRDAVGALAGQAAPYRRERLGRGRGRTHAGRRGPAGQEILGDQPQARGIPVRETTTRHGGVIIAAATVLSSSSTTAK
jgi:hypothetical protein